MGYFHSVMLSDDKCIGCTDCIKRCPTEAIRVRNGKARIINDKCIDCGTCISICQQHAKRAITDSLSVIEKYKYKVALPAPTLYGQFRTTQDVNTILTAVKKLGFDDVFEVSHAAEMVTAVSKELINGSNMKKPVISSACPAITRLIASRFPSLIENIIPIISPMEASARLAKKVLSEEKGIPLEDIGVFFISPCGAKATDVKFPIGIEASSINGVIAIKDIYMRLRGIIKKIDNPEPLSQSSSAGIDWALTGGEGRGLNIENAISVDGVENVIKVLEELENGQLENVDFIEGLACVGGCIGGPLAIKNSFVAKNILSKSERNTAYYTEKQRRNIHYPSNQINFYYDKPIEPSNVFNLDSEMENALIKLEKINAIYDKLPHIDCGSCGAPTCRTLAEDVVKGSANVEDCLFMLRQKVRELAELMVSLSEKLPPSIGNQKNHEKRS